MRGSVVGVMLLMAAGCAAPRQVGDDGFLYRTDLHTAAEKYLNSRIASTPADYPKAEVANCYADYVVTLYTPEEKEKIEAWGRGAQFIPEEGKALLGRMDDPADRVSNGDYSQISGTCPELVNKLQAQR